MSQHWNPPHTSIVLHWVHNNRQSWNGQQENKTGLALAVGKASSLLSIIDTRGQQHCIAVFVLPQHTLTLDTILHLGL